MRRLPAVRVSRAPHTLEALPKPLRRRRAVAEPVEADENGAPAERHQAHPHRLAQTPPHSVARGNVEPHPPRARAVEREPAVHLEEREVQADEDDVIRNVRDVDLYSA